MRVRDKGGRFTPKSEEQRKVRTVRATDAVWNELGRRATDESVTRADLLEMWMSEDAGTSNPQQPSEKISPEVVEQLRELIAEALTIPSNKGGGIKKKLRDMQALIGDISM